MPSLTAKDTLRLLRAHESRNITFMESDGSWPIVWGRASGTHVWDTAGRRYVDLTAAFGVANAGHANPCVVQAAQQQAGLLLHAMGDVHPHALKAQLALELSRLTFERWSKFGPRNTSSATHRAKTIFCNSGFEAVEAALKTAFLATGRPGVLAFEDAYHGTGYGTLSTTHRPHFRSPFRRQLREFANFIPFPTKNSDLLVVRKAIERQFRRKKVGAVIVEPCQGRGGIRIPPRGFLPLLRKFCDEHNALLIADEVFTGFGRTGKWFACEHGRVAPDLICLGKALTGGFPLSACVGRADVMDAAWPASDGEAIHTSTFLGHPVGCAMALAQIGELRRARLPERSARLGWELLRLGSALRISPSRFKISVRGLGLMAGVEVCHRDGRPATAETFAVVKQMLQRGFLLLPEGPHGNILSLTPPLTITSAQLRSGANALQTCLDRL